MRRQLTVGVAAVLASMAAHGGAQLPAMGDSRQQRPCALRGMDQLTVDLRAIILATTDGSPVALSIAKIVSPAFPLGRVVAARLCDSAEDASRRLTKADYMAHVTIKPQDVMSGTLVLSVQSLQITEIQVVGSSGPYAWLVDQKVEQMRAMKPFAWRRSKRLLYSLDGLPDFSVAMRINDADEVGRATAVLRVAYGGDSRSRDQSVREAFRRPPNDAAISPSMPTSMPTSPPDPAAAVTTTRSASSRVALLIGNAAYPKGVGALANPARDVRLIGQRLTTLGFQVELVENGTRAEMYDAIARLRTRLRRAGLGAVGLFYYSGHGTQIDGTSYLIPVRSEMEDMDEVVEKSVAADNVLAAMDSAGNGLNILILDACRTIPGTRGPLATARGIGALPAKSGSFIAYSTAPNQPAFDGSDTNSPFAQALAAEIEVPDAAIEDVFKRVRVRVRAATGSRQIPWDSSSLAEEFSFNPKR